MRSLTTCVYTVYNIVFSTTYSDFLGSRFNPLSSEWCHMATEIRVNIDSCEGLLPAGTKALPEPVLTFKVTDTFRREHCVKATSWSNRILTAFLITSTCDVTQYSLYQVFVVSQPPVPGITGSSPRNKSEPDINLRGYKTARSGRSNQWRLKTGWETTNIGPDNNSYLDTMYLSCIIVAVAGKNKHCVH